MAIVITGVGLIGAAAGIYRDLWEPFFGDRRDQAVEVDAIVETLARQLSRGEEREQSYRDQIEALTETVKNLAAQRGGPDAPPGLDEALNELSEGRTEAAKVLLQRVAAEKEALGKASFKEAAEAQRYLGALAFLDSTKEALTAYARSTELDPANPKGWNQLGHLFRRTGDLAGAENAYRQVLVLGESESDLTWKAIAMGNLGIVYQIRGELDQAFDMQEKALALNKELERKQGMATNYGNLGVLHKIRGDLDQAVEMYERSLALHEELGAKEGMAIQYFNLGHVHQIRGELDQARDAWIRAQDLFTQVGVSKNVRQTEALLRALQESQ